MPSGTRESALAYESPNAVDLRGEPEAIDLSGRHVRLVALRGIDTVLSCAAVLRHAAARAASFEVLIVTESGNRVMARDAYQAASQARLVHSQTECAHAVLGVNALQRRWLGFRESALPFAVSELSSVLSRYIDTSDLVISPIRFGASLDLDVVGGATRRLCDRMQIERWSYSAQNRLDLSKSGLPQDSLLHVQLGQDDVDARKEALRQFDAELASVDELESVRDSGIFAPRESMVRFIRPAHPVFETYLYQGQATNHCYLR